MTTKPLTIEIDDKYNIEHPSPPPSPPPIHKLYTESSTYRYTNYHYNHTNPSGNSYNNNKPPLLVPKASDLPPSPDEDPKDKKQGPVYKYSKKFFIYLLKQLVKKKNLTLTINLMHQVWRARFFIIKNLQYFKHFITTYPWMAEGKLLTSSLLKLSRLLFILIKKEQHQILKQIVDHSTNDINAVSQLQYQPTLSDLKLLVSLLQLRFTELYKICFKYIIKMIKHFGSWDSIIFFVSSLALTNSITNSLSHF